MGLILDSSILIAEERGKFDLPKFLAQYQNEQPMIAAITASELLHGVERADDPARKARRSAFVESILQRIVVIPFSLAQARVHARIWAELTSSGQAIGANDMLIAAASVALRLQLATLNVAEFRRVIGLNVIDASQFRRS